MEKPKKFYPEAKYFADLAEMVSKGKYRKGGPEGAVVHHTGGSQNQLAREAVLNAIHMGYRYYVITADGIVYQQFDLGEFGFHAGDSINPKTDSPRVSKTLVGIEICSAGRLDEVKPGEFRSWFNQIVKNHRTVTAKTDNIRPGTYQSFTTLQEEALLNLLSWLAINCPCFDPSQIFGHDEVSPGRKNDPGGSLSITMPQLRKLVSEKIIETTKVH